ncbi:MAG: MFS transporter [Acidilobus sp.]
MLRTRRETLLAASFAVMAFNSLYQYSWNVLGPMIASGLEVSLIKVATAFSIFAVLSTVSQLALGPLADARGPRVIAPAAALLSAVGFLGTAFSRDVIEFYVAWGLGSVGEGVLYGIASNVAVKWFPDRRGLATGLVSLGFGLGAAVANPLIESSRDFREAALAIGLVELVALTAIAATLRYPGELRGVSVSKAVRGVSWWLLYATFVFAIVPLVSFSSSLRPLTGLRGYLLSVAVSLFPLFSGLGRPLLGALSDRLGRPKTIELSLVVIAAFSASSIMGPPQLRVASVAMVGLFGGAQIPLFFSIVGDLYGEAFSTSNNAAMYTGKAFSGILGGVVMAALIEDGYGGALVIGSPLLASLLMLVALRTRRRGR